MSEKEVDPEFQIQLTELAKQRASRSPLFRFNLYTKAKMNLKRRIDSLCDNDVRAINLKLDDEASQTLSNYPSALKTFKNDLKTLLFKQPFHSSQ